MDDLLRDRLPSAFRAPRLLRWLNILAVGFSLAAATGFVLAKFIDGIVGPYPLSDGHHLSPVFVCSASTLLFGVVWAGVVRMRIRAFPAGWAASIPLAALNAGTALAVSLHGADVKSTGVACVTVVVSLSTLLAGTLTLRPPLQGGWLIAMALGGVSSGIAAAAHAARRKQKRAVFLAAVESGSIVGYQVDAHRDGAVFLVRIGSDGGGTYRARRVAEPVVELTPRAEGVPR